MKYKIPKGAIIKNVDSDYNYTDNNKRTFSGLWITTNKGDIKLLITDYQLCYESWGCEYLETPDDISKVIGATLLQ